jgi:hypothetical protein
VIFVDDQQLGFAPDWEGRQLIPFLERDGVYWGAPLNDDDALAELERQMRAGARWIVFAWPSLWWTDEYRRLHRHLLQHFSCPSSTPNAKVFELREVHTGGTA